MTSREGVAMTQTYSAEAVDAAFNVAVDHYEAGRLDRAMELLQFLAFVAPTDRGVWRALARCHEDLGQSEVGAFLISLSETLTPEVTP
jgi:Flp pilus assembly protein TadD